jgi:predicted Holliday junction resolvase-like endonuclease
LNYNPLDIKPVFFPIDFLVFKGMNQKEFIDDIILLSMKTDNSAINSLRENVELAVIEKNYEWKEARIDENGGVAIN